MFYKHLSLICLGFDFIQLIILIIFDTFEESLKIVGYELTNIKVIVIYVLVLKSMRNQSKTNKITSIKNGLLVLI
jgi:hypothetical protein